jgi:hypothetical protein
MRKLLLPLLLFACTLTARAQSTVIFSPTHPGQPTAQCDFQRVDSPIMFLCIDWVDPASGTIAGWWYDRRTGHAPTGPFLLGPHGPIAPGQTLVIPRPDVAAFAGTPDANLGFGIIAGPMTAGYYALTVSDLPWSWDCGYDVYNGFFCGWVAPQVVFRIQ